MGEREETTDFTDGHGSGEEFSVQSSERGEGRADILVRHLNPDPYRDLSPSPNLGVLSVLARGSFDSARSLRSDHVNPCVRRCFTFSLDYSLFANSE